MDDFWSLTIIENITYPSVLLDNFGDNMECISTIKLGFLIFTYVQSVIMLGQAVLVTIFSDHSNKFEEEYKIYHFYKMQHGYSFLASLGGFTDWCTVWINKNYTL